MPNDEHESGSAPPGKTARDVALLHGPTDDGKGARVLRLRDGELSAGEVRPVEEGKPLVGKELVRLRGRKEHPALCDVEVLYSEADDGPSRGGRSAGPPRVSTAAYRKGWGKVFGKRTSDPDHSLN